MSKSSQRIYQCFTLTPKVARTLWNEIKANLTGRFVRASWESRGLVMHPTALLYYENGSQIDVKEKCWLGAYSVVVVSSDSRGGGYEPHLSLGNRVYIGDQCNIRAAGGTIRIGNNVLIGNHVTMVATNHGVDASLPISEQPWASDPSGVELGSDVWIGAHAVLLPGTRIGDGAIVAAGAVVKGEVKPFCIVGGVPARVLKSRL